MLIQAIFNPLLLVCCLALYLFPALLSAGTTTGFTLLVNRVLPAIFPFMVVTKILQKGEYTTGISQKTAPFTSRVFGIDGGGILAIFAGFLAGFPLGVVTACSLYKQGKISKRTCEKLIFFCSNPSPAFVISGVGLGVFNSTQIGIIIYTSILLSALLAGIIQNLFACKEKTTKMETTHMHLPFSNVLVDSVKESVVSMALVGGFLLFFSSLSPLIDALPFSPLTTTILTGLLEVTSGVFSLPNQVNLIPLSAFLCSFGGLCVCTQSAVFLTDSKVSFYRYLSGRFIIGIFSFAFTTFFMLVQR